MNKRTARTAVSLILSFVLCLSFCGVLLSIDLSLGFCNSKRVTESINKSNYTEEAYKSFEQKVADLSKKQKLPEDVLKGVVKEGKFYLESGKAIKKSLAGKDVYINTENVKADATSRIKSYFKRQKITVNAQMETAVKDTAQMVSSYYRENISFDFGRYFNDYQKSIMSVIKVLLPVCFALVIILTIVLCRMYHHRHRGLRFAAYGIMGATLIDLAVGIYLTAGEPFKIKDVSDCYTGFTDTFVNGCVAPFWVTAGISLVIFIGILCFIKRCRRLAE